MELSEKLIDMIEEAGFTFIQDEDVYQFETFSSRGQDFIFSINSEGTLDQFRDKILDYYNSFDVSYETYLWLDETGHGKNGAPYDMLDVYKDMEECKEFIDELYFIVDTYIEHSK